MKILVLTSRYTATRDIINEDFGRQVRLFEALRKFKHDIDFFCVDYRKLENKNAKLHGINVFIRPLSMYYFLNLINSLNNILKIKKYDLLIATSDPLWGAFGYYYAKKYNIKFLYDLHDNYEVYLTYKMPFFGLLNRKIIKNADLVTTVSYALRNLLIKRGIRRKKVWVIQNGVDFNVFKPMDKNRCRKKLNLPLHKKIIIYAGSLQRSQGIDVLLQALQKVRKKNKDAILVLAGRFFGNEGKYINVNKPNIKFLGSIKQDKVAELINAADVAVVPNRANAFTKYCFPYKVVEYAACQKPIVATNVGDVAKFIGDYKDCLCMPDDSSDMAKKILIQLKKEGKKVRYNISNNTWKAIASKLNKIILSI